jgi:uncharacterized protein YdeI (YjbR/CyaY-like superfamily)
VSDSYPRVAVSSREEWRSWLSANHGSAPGAWVVTFRRGEPDRHVSYEEIVLEAVAHGWIDSTRRRLDERRTEMLVTPRKPGSGWSRSNKERVAKLEREGLMTPAGRRAVEIAKENGAWSLLDEVEDMVEPDDLKAALAAVPKAREHWDAFPPSARKAALLWIATAKRPETRERRIAETARLAGENKRPR